MDLNTAKIIITGGSTGIGYETARQLISKGAKVVICSRNKSEIEKAAQEIGAIGLQADISKEDEVKALFKEASEKLGGLNVLINNAGIGYLAPLTETSEADFSRIWETNVKGAFLAGKEAANYFIAQNEGFATGTAYCASKFAVSAMTECWRAELRKNNIRVMQVNPSEVVTPFGTKLGYEAQNVDSKLKPSEIAHTIVSMLEMDNVGFITDATVWATNP